MNNINITKQECNSILSELVKKYQNDKEISKQFVKHLTAEDLAVIDNLVAETTFSRRRYGRGQFYCWASHEALNRQDPWPANIYPKDVLRKDFAISLSR